MQLFTGIWEILGQKQICYHWPGVPRNSETMHCGLLISMSYLLGWHSKWQVNKITQSHDQFMDKQLSDFQRSKPFINKHQLKLWELHLLQRFGLARGAICDEKWRVCEVWKSDTVVWAMNSTFTLNSSVWGIEAYFDMQKCSRGSQTSTKKLNNISI